MLLGSKRECVSPLNLHVSMASGFARSLARINACCAPVAWGVEGACGWCTSESGSQEGFQLVHRLCKACVASATWVRGINRDLFPLVPYLVLLRFRGYAVVERESSGGGPVCPLFLLECARSCRVCAVKAARIRVIDRERAPVGFVSRFEAKRVLVSVLIVN